jgi:hypothetical protein
MTTVDLSGRHFDLESLQSEPSQYSTWFERAKAETGSGKCLCTPAGLRLVIRQMNGLYHLAGWPLEGNLHGANCAFYKTPPEWTGRSGYSGGAIVDREDGSADIATEVPLKVRVEEREPRGPRSPLPSTSGPSKSRSRIGMLGLMHELWEAASLNRWAPGWSRSWSRCRWQLRTVQRTIDGVASQDCLHVVHPFEEANKGRIEAEFASFRARLGVRGGFRYRGYVMAELKRYTPTKFGYRIDVRHQSAPYFASKPLIEAVEKSSRAVMAARENPEARTVVLMLVNRHDKGYMEVVNMAVMLTTKTYIPCESSHELRMADALADAGRAFIKPLRYDGAEDSFPDFQLIDTDPQTIVEVYGMMSNPAYDRRKAEKQAAYRAKRVPVIEWDTRLPMPYLGKQRSAA